MKINKNKTIHVSIISVFVLLYFFVSIISMIHVIDFFELSNNNTMSLSLAIAFELGAAASLASIIVMHRMKKGIVWSLFILLTLMQAMGNMYNSFANLADFQQWIELFGLTEEPIIVQKRILATISGLPLPLIALGFIKALIDYIRPYQKNDEDETTESDGYLDYDEYNDRNNNPVSSSNENEQKKETSLNLDDIEKADQEAAVNETQKNEKDLQQKTDKTDKYIEQKDVYDEKDQKKDDIDRTMMPRRRNYGSGSNKENIKNNNDNLSDNERKRIEKLYKDFKKS